jgi:membrane-associated phospholipid phosphatase
MNKNIFLSAVLCIITLPSMIFAKSNGTGLYFPNYNPFITEEFLDSVSVFKQKLPDNISFVLSDNKNNGFMIHNADTDSLNTLPSLKWYEMFSNIPGDVVKFYDKEFTLNRIPMYVGIAVVTTGLIITDNQTWKASDKFYNRNSLNKNLSDLFVDIGDGKSQFGLAGAFAAYGLITHDDRSLRTASEVIEAVLTSGAVVQVLKHITGRESPYLSTKPGGAWRFFPNQIEYFKHVPAHDAYPSGHLTTSLSAFVVIAEDYPEAKWIAPVSYGAETLLAVSMVNQGIHWYSDYPLAMLLGYTFGKIAAHPITSVSNNSKISDLQISPYVGYIYKGVRLSFYF